ncbi:MFS transporter [Streptomyces sp. NPDC051657]|uniref:MFS transporter n=1 Tax=unclassified Streptomyces TaxID=2593676 RepID=UPI003439541F
MDTARSRWIALTVLCIGTLMTILDETIVNVALPVMREELGFSQGGVSWVINAYLIAYGGLLIFAGRLGDLIGHKNVLLLGVSLFTISSVVAGFSQNAPTLVAARFGQGAGAALVTAVTLAIIVMMFQEPGEQTRAIGFYSFTFAGGGALGLIAGGVLMELTTWHWLFFINLPIGVISVILGWKLLPGGKGLGLSAGLDVSGAALLVSSVSLLVYGIVNAEHNGWTGSTLAYLVGAVVLMAAFVIRQKKAKAPLFNLNILSDRDVAGANIVQFLVSGGLYGSFFVATLYLQQVLGYTPMEMALAFLPLTVITALGSIALSPYLTGKLGERVGLIIGLAIFLAGALFLARTPLKATYAMDVLPSMFLLGLGIGLCLPPIMSLAMSTASEDEVGVISGLTNSTGQVGGALWVAIVASAAGSVTASRMDGGTNERESVNAGLMYGSLVLAGALVLAIVVAAFVIRRRSTETAADGAAAKDTVNVA